MPARRPQAAHPGGTGAGAGSRCPRARSRAFRALARRTSSPHGQSPRRRLQAHRRPYPANGRQHLRRGGGQHARPRGGGHAPSHLGAPERRPGDLRHRPGHVQGHRPVSDGRRPPGCRARLGPEDALRHQRPGQQPDAHRSVHLQAEGAQHRCGRPLQPVLHPRRNHRDCGGGGSEPPGFSRRPFLRPPQGPAGGVPRRRSHRLLRRRLVPRRHLRVLGTAGEGGPALPGGGGVPQARQQQSPGHQAGSAGRIFYVADRNHGGVYEIDAATFREIGFLPTGKDTHGLYPSRDARFLYVTNRGSGSVTVVDFATRRAVAVWQIPRGRSPDMGGVSADGAVLWPSGRYDGAGYAISTKDGHLIARVPVPAEPHGLCVWPQPGRFSLGHTGVMR